MRTTYLAVAGAFTLVLATTSYAGSIRIPIPPVPPPPPAPVIVVPDAPPPPPREPAPDVVFVAPPAPSFIKVNVSYPNYWFYDDHKDMWFYYEKGRRPHYVRHHEWHDDGRHFYGSNRSWHKVDRGHARRMGWYKHHDRKERREDRREDRRDSRRDHRR